MIKLSTDFINVLWTLHSWRYTRLVRTRLGQADLIWNLALLRYGFHFPKFAPIWIVLHSCSSSDLFPEAHFKELNFAASLLSFRVLVCSPLIIPSWSLLHEVDWTHDAVEGSRGGFPIKLSFMWSITWDMKQRKKHGKRSGPLLNGTTQDSWILGSWK